MQFKRRTNLKYIITLIILIILSALILISKNSYAQARSVNIDFKYENYRNNLRQNYLLGIGDKQGYSLAASERRTNTGEIKWADATISLGHYLGVLATEYYLYKQDNRNTEQTIKELYYAISTLYRLDYTAETFYYDENKVAGKPSLNGFFVRDDIDIITKTEYQTLNNGSQINVKSVNSDLLDIDTALGYSTNNEMSKDQVIFLLMGLRLIEKYIPDSTVYMVNNEIKTINYSNGISDIKTAAEKISTLILEYISSNKKIFGWYIKNPTTGKTVKRGYNAYHFQAKAYNSIYKRYNQGESLYGGLSGLFASFENGILKLGFNTIVKMGQGHMVLTMAAISNQFGSKTQKIIMKYSFKDYKSKANYEWEALLYNVLYPSNNEELNFKKEWFDTFLKSAPMNGPYNYKDTTNMSYDWSASRRTTQPESRGNEYNGYKANFNGLDYMLIYNLYKIYYSPKLPK